MQFVLGRNLRNLLVPLIASLLVVLVASLGFELSRKPSPRPHGAPSLPQKSTDAGFKHSTISNDGRSDRKAIIPSEVVNV